MHFLFPADLLNSRVPDEHFAEQRAALEEAGFSTVLLPDEVLSDGRSLRALPEGAEVVYRGWMLKPAEYGRLCAAIGAAGGVPFTSPEQYVQAHYLPHWYPLLADLTPETRVYPADAFADADLAAEVGRLDWDGYFVKDYVKSLKTSTGAIIRRAEDLAGLLTEMRKYRGEIEGGVCVRRVEAFVPESERRYFVLEGTAYGPDAGDEIPDPVRECAARVPSRFFSVDVVRREDGLLRVVEIGDGQVSDLVGWTPGAFARMWGRGL